MWKAIKKFVREYRELGDESKRVFLSEPLSFLCYRNPAWRDHKQEIEEEMFRQAALREIAEKEFVPFVYWDVLFDLQMQNGQQLAFCVTRFEPGRDSDWPLYSARDDAGKIYVGDNATLLRATEVFVDTVDDLPDWCPLARCEHGTYRTSPQWVKDGQE